MADSGVGELLENDEVVVLLKDYGPESRTCLYLLNQYRKKFSRAMIGSSLTTKAVQAENDQ